MIKLDRGIKMSESVFEVVETEFEFKDKVVIRAYLDVATQQKIYGILHRPLGNGLHQFLDLKIDEAGLTAETTNIIELNLRFEITFLGNQGIILDPISLINSGFSYYRRIFIRSDNTEETCDHCEVVLTPHGVPVSADGLLTYLYSPCINGCPT